jgi:hypothetical protein
MTEGQRTAAANAFWIDPESMAEQAEVVVAIARRINFRVKSVQQLSAERKAKHLATMATLSDPVAARLLVTYHLTCQRPMMSAFLDALGITHEHGLIAEENMQAPEPSRLDAAAKQLLEAFPREDVQVYFSTLRLQDPELWAGLEPFSNQ